MENNETEIIGDTNISVDDDLKTMGFTDEQIVQLNSIGNEETPVSEERPIEETNTDVDIESLKTDAEFGKQWKTLFTEDPVHALRIILESGAVNIDDVSSLVSSLSAPVDLFDPTQYEAQTPFEQDLLKNYDWVTNGRDEFNNALKQRDENIVSNYMQTHFMTVAFEAMAKELGFTLPSFDYYDRFMTDPNTTIESLTKEYTAQLNKSFGIEKQQAKERPNSLTTKGVPSIDTTKLKSMEEISNYYSSLNL